MSLSATDRLDILQVLARAARPPPTVTLRAMSPFSVTTLCSTAPRASIAAKTGCANQSAPFGLPKEPRAFA